MADRRAQLEWVHKNRRKRSREVSAGDAVGRITKDLLENDGGRPGLVSGVVDRVVDPEFRRTCSVLSVERGCVTIAVREASLVGWMERRWRSAILNALQAEPGGQPVRAVRFRYAGVNFANTGEERE